MAHKHKASKAPNESKQHPHKRTKLDTLSSPANAISRSAPATGSLPRPPASPPPRHPNPVTPTSTQPSRPDILPHPLAHLQHKYSLATLSVISSSKIAQKVRTLLSHLSAIDLSDLASKPSVVALHAKAPVAAKMVSVVEIAKREVEKERGKWWQYTRLEGKVEELKDKSSETKNMGEGKGRRLTAWDETRRAGYETKDGSKVAKTVNTAIPDAATSEEDAFEPMPPLDNSTTGNPDMTARPKLRAIPILTIYLSRVPVPEFKVLYGEQTNA